MEISDLIKKADNLLDSATGTIQNVSRTADNLDAITSKINNGSGTMGALINDKKVYQNVSQATAEMQEDAEAAKHNFLMSHFFHKRGYEDSADLTKNEIGRLPSEPATRRFSWNGLKLFEKDDTAKLKDAKSLNEAGAFLQANPFGLAVVAGYADKGDSTQEKTFDGSARDGSPRLSRQDLQNGRHARENHRLGKIPRCRRDWGRRPCLPRVRTGRPATPKIASSEEFVGGFGIQRGGWLRNR